jgi:K+-sensing histidine kinase KdpD
MNRDLEAKTKTAIIKCFFLLLFLFPFFVNAQGLDSQDSSISIWFVVVPAVIIIAVMYFIFKRRLSQFNKKQKPAPEKEFKEITDELSDRNKELAVINDVQQGLVSRMDIAAIYDLVGNKIRDTFDAQVTLIGSFDEAGGLEHFNYTIENGKRFYPGSRPLDKLRKQLIETKQKIVIENQEQVVQWFGNKVVGDSKPIKSGVFVPLLLNGHAKGYVSLQNVDRENAFSDSDIRLLETLANSMSVALENARLFDETTRLLKETEQRNSELAIINSVQEGLVAQMNMEGIYTLVGDRIRDLFDAQIVVIRSFDYKNEAEIVNYAIENGGRLDIKPRSWDNFSRHLIRIKKP